MSEAKCKVSTGLLESYLFGGRQAFICGAEYKDGVVIFTLYGSDVPEAEIVTVRTVTSRDTFIEPV